MFGVFLRFLVSAGAVVIAGILLTRAAEAIATRTRLGAVWVGGILLAAGTSLPELVATVSAARSGLPDIAAGNLFGSNLFNIMIIAAADAVYRKRSIIHDAAVGHLLSAGVGIVLISLAALGVLLKLDFELFGFGFDTLTLLLVYLLGTWLLGRFESQPPEKRALFLADGIAVEAPEDHHHTMTLKMAFPAFLVASGVIVLAGTALTAAAEEITVRTALSASFVGTILVAVATSLPEMTACIAAARIGAINLAVGNALGSNIFNMVLFFAADVAYRPGPIMAAVSPIHAVTALFSLVMSSVVLIGLLYRSRRQVAGMGLDSVAILAIYLLVMVFLFRTS